MTLPAHVTSNNLSARLREGWRAIRDGRYQDAEALFFPLWIDYPHSSDAAQGLAWAYLCGDREDEGDRLMNLIANFALPGFAGVLATLEQEAKDAARKGESVPRSIGEALLLSHGAQYQNNGEEALRLAHRARQMASGNRFVETNYACCLVIDKRYDEALPLLQALTAVSRRPILWHNIGFAEHKRGNRAVARHAWHQALQIVPDYVLSHQALRWEALCRFRLVTAYRHHAAAHRGRNAARFAEQAARR